MILIRSLYAVSSLQLTATSCIAVRYPQLASCGLIPTFPYFDLISHILSLTAHCSLLSQCSTRYSLHSTHGSYIASSFLFLICCLLVLTERYLLLFANDHLWLVLPSSCSRTDKRSSLILFSWSLRAASIAARPSHFVEQNICSFFIWSGPSYRQIWESFTVWIYFPAKIWQGYDSNWILRLKRTCTKSAFLANHSTLRGDLDISGKRRGGVWFAADKLFRNMSKQFFVCKFFGSSFADQS